MHCALPLAPPGAKHDCRTNPSAHHSTIGAADPYAELDRVVHQTLSDRFRIGTLLGRDRRTHVYAAHEIDPGRRVALRIIPWPRGRSVAMEDQFRQAMAAVAALDHAHIVPAYGFGASARFLWCATQFIEGRSLDAVLRDDGSLDLPRCLRIFEQVASALHYAHRRGVMHGHIQPSAVWLDAHGWARVGDFGIARIIPALQAEKSQPMMRPSELCPDGFRGMHPAQDQWHLAATVYRCLTGASPLDADLAAEHSMVKPGRDLRATHPSLPSSVAPAIERALSPDPAARFRTVLDFMSALSTATAESPTSSNLTVDRPAPERQRVLLVNGHRPGARWTRVAGVAASALVGLAVVAGWLSSDRPAVSVPPYPQVLAHNGVEAAIPTKPGADHESVDLLGQSTEVLAPSSPSQTFRSETSLPASSAHRVSQPAPGRLFINSMPWGRLYVDGRSVGNTPLADLKITPGEHHLRVVRDGFRTFEAIVTVSSGQEVRMTDILLEPLGQ